MSMNNKKIKPENFLTQPKKKKEKKKKKKKKRKKYNANGPKVMKKSTTTQPLGKLKEYFFPNPKIISN